jgi:DnaJ-class molecular chaperone
VELPFSADLLTAGQTYYWGVKLKAGEFVHYESAGFKADPVIANTPYNGVTILTHGMIIDLFSSMLSDPEFQQPPEFLMLGQLIAEASGGGVVLAYNKKTGEWTDKEEFASFSERGQDIEADILVSLEEALKGSIRSISLQLRAPCAQCRGSGQLAHNPCASCHGTGHTSRVEPYQVRIPAGVREGQRLRLAGRGQAGAGSGSAGDLFLRVRLARHPDFTVDGNHLQHTLELTPWEAVLGAKVTVPTLGQPLSIKVPPGSQNGQRLRIRSQGLPLKDGTRGDLYVQLRIEVPDHITESERALWQQLARESSFNPRRPDAETGAGR